MDKTLSQESRFSSPDEELKYLEDRVVELKRAAETEGIQAPLEDIAHETVQEYKERPVEEAITPGFQKQGGESLLESLELPAGDDDEQVERLLHVVSEQGIKNAFQELAKGNNAHLDDDLHRALVQWLKKNITAGGIDQDRKLSQSLNMTLYEITPPNLMVNSPNASTFQELAQRMEQLYAGMQSIASDTMRLREHGSHYYTLEVAMSRKSDEIILYASVPNEHTDLFEQNMHALFPDLQLEAKKEDYNIFIPNGETHGSYATQVKESFFPLKTHEEFQKDPFVVILEAFSQIAWEDEGAAIQFVVAPAGDYYASKFRKSLELIQKGASAKDATKVGGTMAQDLKQGVVEMIFGPPAYKKEDAHVDVDSHEVELVSRKIEAPIVETNIRIVASAANTGRASKIVREIQAAFNQFEVVGSNKLSFITPAPRALRQFVEQYIYRMFEMRQSVPLNMKELATLFHFLAEGEDIPQLKMALSKKAAAPSSPPGETADEGIVIGINAYHGEARQIRMSPKDRLRHMYAIGQTGTGKTTLLKNMIIQDIQNGEGVCFIDPHGEDLDTILSAVPDERIDDVIYFDPGYVDRPMGLNMLEYDPAHPEQKTFVANEMMSIFNKLFDMKTTGGPMFEQYFRNSVLLAIDDHKERATLLEINRVLSNDMYRKKLLAKCTNPVVVQFWEEVAQKAGGEASLANMVPYITSKFDVFLTNDIMRPIIAQPVSVLNFRQIMDEQKILLVNLSKGRLGDINANLIGLILVGKILMAALGRVDIPQAERKNFYLYIDEFQNVTTDSISTILSEARKYCLSLNVAHQYIAQLDDGIRDSIFGNVGSMAVGRISSEDAEFVAPRFAPTFTAADIMKIENFNAYVSLLVNGVPVKPFNIKFEWYKGGDRARMEKLKDLSRLRYGKGRQLIEKQVLRKYRESMQKPKAPVRPGVPGARPVRPAQVGQPVQAGVRRSVRPVRPAMPAPPQARATAPTHPAPQVPPQAPPNVPTP